MGVLYLAEEFRPQLLAIFGNYEKNRQACRRWVFGRADGIRPGGGGCSQPRTLRGGFGEGWIWGWIWGFGDMACVSPIVQPIVPRLSNQLSSQLSFNSRPLGDFSRFGVVNPVDDARLRVR